jgi:hypothetical protein
MLTIMRRPSHSGRLVQIVKMRRVVLQVTHAGLLRELLELPTSPLTIYSASACLIKYVSVFCFPACFGCTVAFRIHCTSEGRNAIQSKCFCTCACSEQQ